MKVRSKIIRNTFYNADCIDFCSVEPYKHLFVVGTYELVNQAENINTSEGSLVSENKNERLGRIYLYSIENEDLKSLQQINMAGILDLRWCSHRVKDKVVLGVVNAIGRLIIFTLEDGKSLNQIIEIEVTSGLALYLDWSTLITPCSSPLITVSDSNGYFYVYLLEDWNLSLVIKSGNHNYETWVTSFNYWDTNIVYTGADDCRLIGHDIRTKDLLTFVSREHSAGVTSIQTSLWKDTLLFSGCYNGDLNSWDLRKMKSPVQKINLGGGVWRLRCEPCHKPLLVASAMHNNFQILNIDDCDKSDAIVTYSGHESLAYGADWCRLSKNNSYLLGSVSFYDKLLTLWEFEIENFT